MVEKWSERWARKEKVDRLKERLISEIHEVLQNRFDVFCRAWPAYRDLENVRNVMDEVHILYVLKDYLKKEDRAFMQFARRHGDIVVYKIAEDTIDWFLQADCLISRIICKLHETNCSAEAAMNDEFFVYEVFSVIDQAIWEKRKVEE